MRWDSLSGEVKMKLDGPRVAATAVILYSAGSFLIRSWPQAPLRGFNGYDTPQRGKVRSASAVAESSLLLSNSANATRRPLECNGRSFRVMHVPRRSSCRLTPFPALGCGSAGHARSVAPDGGGRVQMCRALTRLPTDPETIPTSPLVGRCTPLLRIFSAA